MAGIDRGANGRGGYDLDARVDFDATSPGMSGLELGEAPAPPLAATTPHQTREVAIDGRVPMPPPIARSRPYAPPPVAQATTTPPYKALAIAVALLAITGLWLGLRKTTMPDLLVADADKNPLHLADLRGGHPKLLLVFLGAGDPFAPFALNAIREASARAGDALTVVGLTVGGDADADHIHTSMNLPFPMYSLRDAPNPFIVRDFLKKGGIVPSRVYSSTTMVLDDQQHLLLFLQGDDVRHLPEKLAAIAP